MENNLKRREFMKLVGGMSAFGIPAMEAYADPSVIKVNVGFPPGGAADSIGRLMATLMGDAASMFVVENKPGLQELQAATAGHIALDYKEVKGGAELIYKTSNPQLVVALHKWFDAQVSDHGKDAKEGYSHKH